MNPSHSKCTLLQQDLTSPRGKETSVMLVQTIYKARFSRKLILSLMFVPRHILSSSNLQQSVYSLANFFCGQIFLIDVVGEKMIITFIDSDSNI